MTRARHRRSRAALLWGLGLFAALQLALAAVMERWRPELRDPEYGWKLARLRALLAREPGQPLVVVLGSSRAAVGFRPDVLRDSSTAEPAPVVFNFAIAGAGPLTELLGLTRLLEEGIRPDWVVVEVMPPLLHQEAPWAEENRLPLDRLAWSDLALLRRYWPRPFGSGLSWLQGRLAPWWTNRFAVLSRWGPHWLPWDLRQDRWRLVDRHGWLPFPRATVSVEEYRRSSTYARREYAPCFERFHITANADRALRDLLAVCRREAIGVTLLTMPEGSAFRGWYPEAGRTSLEAYLTGLSRVYAIAWVDARTWVADDRFSDGHHLLAGGATVFTKRFGREVLDTLVERHLRPR